MKKTKPILPMSAERVLMATDLSSLSAHALPLALALLKRGGKLRIFHAVEPVYVPTLSGPEVAVPVYDAKLTMHSLELSLKSVKALASRCKGVKAEGAAAEGHPVADLIGREAKRFKADLVVLATHGRGGFSRLLFGSVASRLLAHYDGEVVLLRIGRGR